VVNGSLTHCTAFRLSRSEMSSWRQQAAPAPPHRRHRLSFSLPFHPHHHPLLTAVPTPRPWIRPQQLSHFSPHPPLARDERLAYQSCRMRATAVLWTLELLTLRQALANSHLRRLLVVSVRQQSGRKDKRGRLSPRRLHRHFLRLTRRTQRLTLSAQVQPRHQSRAAAVTAVTPSATAVAGCAASTAP
jgi:hypothetical protein